MNRNNCTTQEPADEFLMGKALLQRVWEMQEQHEVITLRLLDTGQLGLRTPQIYEGLGNGLSLLSQLASCQWGCRGGEHIIENLVRRLCNYAFAAIRLAALGLYDEGLGAVRSLAEISNLLQLFYLDSTTLQAWQKTPEAQRREAFKPSKPMTRSWKCVTRRTMRKSTPSVSQLENCNCYLFVAAHCIVHVSHA